MSDDQESNPIFIDISDAELAEARAYSMVIAWSPEDDVYVVSVPELAGLHTHGHTPSEAEAMGEEAIALWLAANRDLGRPVPPPASRRRRIVIAPAEPVDANRIRQVRARLGLSPSEFASALNVSPTAVDAWERNEGEPDGASARILEIAERHPALFLSLIQPPAGARVRDRARSAA